MSSHEQAVASLISQLALSFDGAVLGAALAYAAFRTIFRFKATSTALRKIRGAPYFRVADLRSLLEEDRSDFAEEPIVVIRGAIEARSAADGRSLKGHKNNALVSQESGDKAVIIERTQTYIYHEWRGLFGWTSDLRAIIGRSWNKKESISMRTVPFILIDGGQWPQSDFVIVNMDGSKHPLPLTTVYHQLHPINASPYTFLQALFGHEYPVGLLDEEKILPLGKEISAVGICRLNNGVPEIKSCKDLPFFLTEMTKDQMLLDLAFKSKILFWSGIVLGSLSIGILGYAFVRNLNKWKERRQRRIQESTSAAADESTSQIDLEEETGDVPDGELCVICLMRRRRSAFIPCGHLVCCQHCAISVERELVPKCPVCRMAIRSSVRIYAS
ncbi:putative leucine-rich repeat receptor-like protein kinase [Hibiscus syriacus]|uniref:RING-type E3 ubiquitin transferase n=1 Tax=Hibiscus syriacus TaxID=106335 RepID=A0A6A3CLY0_HIBSY|nr:E3 ubiquitin-protein ligase SPL2-like [Hibiscus syriacus]KAE8728612.1 putative leucine-rich repeat receptor-like protein kinase [Hibiscus syriacus]